MGRPGLTQHRKFLRLARLVGSAPLALGSLELMWEKCYINGEAYLGDVVDVEAASQWPGEPGVLCRALLDAGGEGNPGFIEEVEERPGHYRCHDLFDHAPRYVAKRMAREMERKQKGESLSQIRAEAGSAGGHATAANRQANGQQTDSKRQQVDVTPAPAPAPAPAPIKNSPEPGKPDSEPVVSGVVLMTLPCVGSGAKEWPITQDQCTKWQEAFPGLDVQQELRKMRLWLDESPTKRKTFQGMGRFVVGWLGRAQDQGGPRASPAPYARRSAPQPVAADKGTQAQIQKLVIPKLEPFPLAGAR